MSSRNRCVAVPTAWRTSKRRPDLAHIRKRIRNFASPCSTEISGSSLPGSDADLVAAIQSDKGHLIYRSLLRIGEDSGPNPEYWMYSLKTAIGRLPIALYGYSFHWDDLLYIAHTDMSEGGLSFVPEVLLAVGASWFIVRRGLSPLNVAARRVAQIDMNGLDGRISHNDLPIEVMPFVSAVNETLTRTRAWRRKATAFHR